MPSAAAESIVFDMNLLQCGVWKKQERELIEEWIKEDNFDDKRSAAANLLSVLVPEVLNGDCSTDGKIKSKRIGQTLHYFEDLLITTKAGMAKKFYRDHLNHMLRVMILANAMCSKVACFSSLKKEIKLVILSSLVHDIAYPIAESYHILGETIKSMSKCYEALSFTEFKINFREEKIKKLTELLGSKVLTQETLNLLKRENDHGLIGAIEFIDYVNAEKIQEYRQVLQAIVFHNTAEQIPESLQDDYLIKLLILSDEIQDWGRPIGMEKESAMPAIKEFNLTSEGIKGRWEWRNYANISPLRQIVSKMNNLNRVEWPGSLNVLLEFKLPEYRVIETTTIETLAKKITKFCETKRKDCINSFNEAWHEKKELLKMYYGEGIPIAENLFDFSSSESFDECNLIHFDTEGKEALVTPKEFVKVSHVKFLLEKGKNKLMLSNNGKYEEGTLFSQNHTTTKTFLQSLMSKIIIFQGLASRMPQKSGEVSLYPYPSIESAKKALQMIGEEEKEVFVQNLRILRRCIVDRGLFIFEKQRAC